MAWTMHLAIYELRSPLHIGYYKVGNVQRTRYYIPARALWGAVTEALTRRGFSAEGAPQGDYQAIGQWVEQHCAFGYWFVWENEPLLPRYEESGLKYGNLAVADFERRYLDTHVTTALDPMTNSAQAGSLHEVEFIAPYNRDGARTRFGGWVFLDETARRELDWSEWLRDLRVGGERRYGFGWMRLASFEEKQDAAWRLDESRPRVQVGEKKPLEAHTVVHGVGAAGQIEPFVGRETRKRSDRFGMALTQAEICWTPGSILLSPTEFILTEKGIWRRA